MKTRITELFGIKHPIVLSPMAFVAQAPLVIMEGRRNACR